MGRPRDLRGRPRSVERDLLSTVPRKMVTLLRGTVLRRATTSRAKCRKGRTLCTLPSSETSRTCGAMLRRIITSTISPGHVRTSNSRVAARATRGQRRLRRCVERGRVGRRGDRRELAGSRGGPTKHRDAGRRGDDARRARLRGAVFRARRMRAREPCDLEHFVRPRGRELRCSRERQTIAFELTPGFAFTNAKRRPR